MNFDFEKCTKYSEKIRSEDEKLIEVCLYIKTQHKKRFVNSLILTQKMIQMINYCKSVIQKKILLYLVSLPTQTKY